MIEKNTYYKSVKRHDYEIITKDTLKCRKCGKILKNKNLNDSHLVLSYKILSQYYENKDKYGIYGAIYRIFSKKNQKGQHLQFPGKSYIGQTINAIIKEWIDHLTRAFNEKSPKNRRDDHFSRALRKYGKKREGAIKIFNVKIIQVCYDQEELNNAEKFWIGFFKTQDDQFGFNTLEGGKINPPQLKKEKSPFWKEISIKYLNQGLKESYKTNFNKGPLRKIANDLNIDMATLISRISYIYKDEYGNSMKYMDLRYNYIKKLIEPFIKKGWNASYIGNKVGKLLDISPSNRRNIVNTWCKVIYKGKTFSQVRDEYLKEAFESIVIKSLLERKNITYDKINEVFPGIQKRRIFSKIKDYFDGLKEFKSNFRRILAEALIREGINGYELCQLLGFSKSTSKTGYPKIIRELFWGMNLTQIREFFGC